MLSGISIPLNVGASYCQNVAKLQDLAFMDGLQADSAQADVYTPWAHNTHDKHNVTNAGVEA